MERSALIKTTSGVDPAAGYVRIAIEIVGLLTAAVFLGYVMQRLHHANLSALFLLAVLIIAARHGLWPSIATSALGFLAFNFFFTTPYQTFMVTEDGDIATLVFFLAVATLGGNLASRLRTAIKRRDQALDRISNLYDFSNRMSGAATVQDICQTLVDHLAETLDAGVAIISRSADEASTIVTASHAPGAPAGASRLQLTDIEATEKRREWTLQPAKLMAGADNRLAIHRSRLTEEQRDLVKNLVVQAALAIDRVQLASDLESSRREAERARLRSALLTSVSHDLRTPLASIIGAGSTLQELDGSLAAADRTALLDTVMGESRRLNSYIQNLLDMTRIEHGELRIERDWEEPSDLVGAAIRRVRESWPDASFTTAIPADVGLVFVHGELLVQALHNVLDNALRYSPQDTPVEISCDWRKGSFEIAVTDGGPGLTADQQKRVFDMFYRAESGDSVSGGTGLGLAITRGIMEAHGGTAHATAGPGGVGTRIVLTRPEDPGSRAAGGDDT